MGKVESAFCHCLGLRAMDKAKSFLKKRLDQGMDLTHSRGQVENATASSAGDSPAPDGEPRGI